jgi:surface antigen
VPNGSAEPPKKDSLLIYTRTMRMPYGHVAIITDVLDNYVHIAEQNNQFHYWQGDHARRSAVRCRDGLYYIDDEDKLFGWMEIENDEELHPFNDSDKDKILEKYRQPQSVGVLGWLLRWNKRSDSK